MKRSFAALATTLLAAALGITPAAAQADLQPVPDFGPNPGALSLHVYLPDGLPSGAPAVVALHGCTQTAADYHGHAGWRDLADRGGFAVLYPQQRTANNANRCFNWFQPADSDRDSGEAASIRQMVQHAVDAYQVDAGRIYVTGLSAGGAMTANLLADYPDVFDGGAVMAGIPAKCARDLLAGFQCMSTDQGRTPQQWADLVRGSAPGHDGPWPTVAIFHGTGDTTVAPVNAEELRDQWTAVQGISQTPSTTEQLPAGTTKTEYHDAQGAPLVEQYLIDGMPHAQPVDPGTGTANCGTAGQYYQDTICAGFYAARLWGLA
ncbi:MAG: extracellular catalytic domain type 1 short-chain-length polyhydroxyalkanoate depolymerase [Thermocrispum sp.]